MSECSYQESHLSWLLIVRDVLAQSRPKPMRPIPSLALPPPKMYDTQVELRTARQTMLKEPRRGAIYYKPKIAIINEIDVKLTDGFTSGNHCEISQSDYMSDNIKWTYFIDKSVQW